MAPDVQRLVIGRVDCDVALPGLGAVSDYVVARGRPAVLLCLELTSLHVQPPTEEMGQVVSQAVMRPRRWWLNPRRDPAMVDFVALVNPGPLAT